MLKYSLLTLIIFAEAVAVDVDWSSRLNQEACSTIFGRSRPTTPSKETLKELLAEYPTDNLYESAEAFKIIFEENHKEIINKTPHLAWLADWQTYESITLPPHLLPFKDFYKLCFFIVALDYSEDYYGLANNLIKHDRKEAKHFAQMTQMFEQRIFDWEKTEVFHAASIIYSLHTQTPLRIKILVGDNPIFPMLQWLSLLKSGVLMWCVPKNLQKCVQCSTHQKQYRGPARVLIRHDLIGHIGDCTFAELCAQAYKFAPPHQSFLQQLATQVWDHIQRHTLDENPNIVDAFMASAYDITIGFHKTHEVPIAIAAPELHGKMITSDKDFWELMQIFEPDKDKLTIMVREALQSPPIPQNPYTVFPNEWLPQDRISYDPIFTLSCTTHAIAKKLQIATCYTPQMWVNLDYALQKYEKIYISYNGPLLWAKAKKILYFLVPTKRFISNIEYSLQYHIACQCVSRFFKVLELFLPHDDTITPLEVLAEATGIGEISRELELELFHIPPA